MGVSQTSSEISYLIISSDMSSLVTCLLTLLVIMVYFGPSESRNGGTFRQNVLEGTNRLRTKHGKEMLKEDAALAESAQKWADYLTAGHVCKFDHQDPLPAISRAENIAMTGASAVKQWYNSPGHRRNMMNGRYTRMGAGMASGCKMDGYDAWIAVALYA